MINNTCIVVLDPHLQLERDRYKERERKSAYTHIRMYTNRRMRKERYRDYFIIVINLVYKREQKEVSERV